MLTNSKVQMMWLDKVWDTRQCNCARLAAQANTAVDDRECALLHQLVESPRTDSIIMAPVKSRCVATRYVATIMI